MKTLITIFLLTISVNLFAGQEDHATTNEVKRETKDYGITNCEGENCL